MKKIVSLMLVVVLVLGLAATALAAPSKQTIHVSGKVEDASKAIKVALKYGNAAMFMNQFKVNANGEYNVTFEYSSVKDLVLQVTQGGEDVTTSVTSAYAESKNIVCDADVTDSAISAEKIAEIKELYDGIGDDCLTAVVSYDKNNKLQNVAVSKKADGLDILAEGYKAQDGAAKIKVFMLGGGRVDIPLALKKDQKPIKVLAIGNSYAVDAYAYLDDIAILEGVNLELRIAQMGGATFTKHWKVWTAETEAGRKKYTENGEAVDIAHFLEDGTEYDFITIQQSSAHSGNREKYLEDGENVVKYIRERQPKAEILIHKTWSNEKGSPVEAFEDYYKSNQEWMTEEIDWCVNNASEVLGKVKTDSGLEVSPGGKPLRIIPAGDAVNIARQSPMFQTTHNGNYTWTTYKEPENMEKLYPDRVSLHRDSYHLSHKYGRYMVALVWFSCLTGKSVANDTFVNPQEVYHINDEERAILTNAAERAVVESGTWR